MKKMCEYNLIEYVKRLATAGFIAEYDLKGRDLENVRLLTYNSKGVVENTLFICKGAAFKEEYLIEAVNSGAMAYVSEKKYAVDVPYILVNDIR